MHQLFKEACQLGNLVWLLTKHSDALNDTIESYLNELTNYSTREVVLPGWAWLLRRAQQTSEMNHALWVAAYDRISELDEIGSICGILLSVSSFNVQVDLKVWIQVQSRMTLFKAITYVDYINGESEQIYEPSRLSSFNVMLNANVYDWSSYLAALSKLIDLPHYTEICRDELRSLYEEYRTSNKLSAAELTQLQNLQIVDISYTHWLARQTLPVRCYLLGLPYSLWTEDHFNQRFRLLQTEPLEVVINEIQESLPKISEYSQSQTENTLMKSLRKYNVFDLLYVVELGHVFGFTRDEFEHLLRSKVNPWTQRELHPDILHEMHLRIELARRFGLPSPRSIRQALTRETRVHTPLDSNWGINFKRESFALSTTESSTPWENSKVYLAHEIVTLSNLSYIAQRMNVNESPLISSAWQALDAEKTPQINSQASEVNLSSLLFNNLSLTPISLEVNDFYRGHFDFFRRYNVNDLVLLNDHYYAASQSTQYRSPYDHQIWVRRRENDEPSSLVNYWRLTVNNALTHFDWEELINGVIQN